MPSDVAQLLLEEHKRLKARLEAGRITRDQFTSELGFLTLQDNQGVWWSLDPQRGTLICFDGTRWVSMPSTSTPGAPTPASSPSPSLRLALMAGAVLLPAACGAAWSIYTAAQSKSIDLVSPVLLLGGPLLLLAFRKPLTAVLAPFDSILSVIPAPVRYLAALGLPALLGLGTWALAGGGYLCVNFSIVTSTLAAALLTRRTRPRPVWR